MEKVRINTREISLKIAAVVIAAMIAISSVVAIDIMRIDFAERYTDQEISEHSDSTRPFQVNPVLSQGGDWVPLKSNVSGTPAETHVTISDTSGITIVADFHGFWRNNVIYDGTQYDDIEMPGVGAMSDTGTPKLPCLFEYVEVPHGVDLSIDVLAVSLVNYSGYNISPVVQEYPTAIEYGFNSTLNVSQLYFGPEYSINSFYPGNITKLEGESNSAPWIMRGHRLAGLSFYPIQYNPFSGDMMAYSQLVVKVKYSIPAQIQIIPEPLRSPPFEQILFNTILNYDSCTALYQPTSGTTSIDTIDLNGAEYLIVTTQEFELQANRLAEWKERKGVPSEVVVVDSGSEEQVRDAIWTAYTEWDLVPTYGLLMGDVEFIPANYSLQHRGHASVGVPMFEQSYLWLLLGMVNMGDKGYIASDLGYFTLEGSDYLPEMIYGRISVDTEIQAETIVSKIIEYEQSPPDDFNFYNDSLFASDFQDRDTNGEEDLSVRFQSSIEKIRHYLRDRYEIHINYSCSYFHYDRLPEYDSDRSNIALADLFYDDLIENSQGITSNLVSNSIAPDYPNFGWLIGYDGPPFSDLARYNITPNINEGRFMLLYFGHGGSKNMIYPYDVTHEAPGEPEVWNRQDRDVVEGWQLPCFNTTFFSDLTNGDKTPLVISIACNTGWYDGETDEDVLILTGLGDPNPFEDYANECFAENITRLDGGGAIAAISASRPVEATASKHLMNGLIQAFWPGYIVSTNQPIYEMGSALLFAKLYARSQSSDLLFRVARTTFEAFHLFGDPETQLWTDTPSEFDVSYPNSIGTSGIQRFAVTVREHNSETPVSHAKVCIQGEDVYHVGYTNHRGQVVFNVTPTIYSHLNVTVTKHNYRPHIGVIQIHQSNAHITISDLVVEVGEEVTFTFSGFTAGRDIALMIDEDTIISDAALDSIVSWEAEGANAYHNVWAAVVESHLPIRLWQPVSVGCVLVTSPDEGPDPYIYSLYDPSTWDVTSGVFSWDNPDIEVIGDTVEVTVHNRGTAGSVDTHVALFYAPFGGGLTWHFLEELPLSGVDGTITFTPTTIPQASCFRVILSNGEEAAVNEFDNIGYENLEDIELSSPGNRSFYVGNPTEFADYVFIKVTQLGFYDDVWSASICNYSSQMMDENMNETISLFVDPLGSLSPDEWRLFKVDIFINCVLIAGMIINASEGMMTTPPPPPIIEPETLLIIIGFCGVVIVAVVSVIYIKKKPPPKKPSKPTSSSG
ncbi:MAG: C25 family cysteine peptidase [Candidatus Thorarchaeota archaeon]